MIYKYLIILLFCTGCILNAINIYGLNQDIRTNFIPQEHLKFENDQTLSYAESIDEIQRLSHETDLNYAIRLNKVISKSLAHVHWTRYDNKLYNQLIPIWENYFLYFMGVFSNISEYKRYHFADYKKSLYRGVGMCGDASMVMSQLLTKSNIKNKIISYPNHVVVSAKFKDNQELIFDADFGVVIPHSPQEIYRNPTLVISPYEDDNYPKEKLSGLILTYEPNFKEWNNVKHFITKKYYFEKFVYWLKWPFPIFITLLSIYLYLKFYKKLLVVKN
jgi:hypothetical protein